ncbi:site-specific DNA-methyltransferase [Bacillus sp. PS06]|uniref:site-specific DNA-methyltransferase n=1 Tax=Bacillus sp. PS06 TaxID=2764176 RepID=UPI0017840EAA|nr:site-specific DNA-methyltransferase [Bacillus sp. PS06]MBD8070002.1 site-specific DNA-methyltransferase [Bacillus sp. PS06]
MEKLDGKTLDLTKENINALKQLFPEVVTEGKINFDKLKLVLGEEIETNKERYEFTWHGKARSLKLAQTPSTGTLRPDKVSSKNWDETENLYIEGDNLEVLKLLQKSYFGKIKMIYIDPPYNTGKDFVYKDDFRDNIKNYKERTQQDSRANSETSGRYHTDWLNMIYPRLKLAKNLLKDDGLIFISIDDNEVENLKKICNEIFGENSFLGCIANINNPKGRSDDKYFATAHEYIVVYKKYDAFIGGFEPEDNILKRYNKVDQYGKKYRTIDLRKTGDSDRREDRPKMFYYFIYNENTGEFYPTYEEEVPQGCIKIFPTKDDGSYGRWRVGIETAKERIANLEPYYMLKKQKWTVNEKDYLSDDLKVKPTTVWNFKDVNSERGTEQFIDLGFNKDIFPRPKPIGTIRRVSEISTKEDDIILDFFSGSATSAHAIMQLNAVDGGNRKFILIQLPELIDEETEAYKAGYRNICDIGKERIRLAGNKIVAETGKSDLDIGFKVFKLDSSNVKLWDPNSENLEQDLFDLQNNIKADRSKEDLLFEVLLKIGIPLTTPIEEVNVNSKVVYNVGFGAVLLCLEDEIDLEVVHELIKLKPEDFDSKVIFKETGFRDDSVKTNAIQTLKKNGITVVRSV